MEEDISKALDAVAWGHRIVDLEETTYVFRPLTLEERNIANYIYENESRKAIQRKLKPREQLKKDAFRRGLWRPSYDNDLKLLREELAEQLKAFDKAEKVNQRRMMALAKSGLTGTEDGKYLKLKKRIEYLTRTIHNLENLHVRLIETPSVEYNAERARGMYALGRSALSFPSMTQCWDEHSDLLDHSDPLHINRLMHLYYNATLVDEKLMRKIARAGLWRMRWNMCKKNRGVHGLFGRDMHDLTSDQFSLVYWSMIYDSAFEAMDPPPDHIIEDDGLFDAWLEQKHKERKQKSAQSELDRRVSKLGNRASRGQEAAFSVDGFYCEKCICGADEKPNHVHAPSCSYGVFLYYDKKKKAREVEHIQQGNPDKIRRLLASEQKTMASKEGGMISDQDLRKKDHTRALLGMPTKKHSPGTRPM